MLNRVELCTIQTVACHVALSIGFPRQEYWSQLSCPPAGDLPDPGLKPTPASPALVQFSSVQSFCCVRPFADPWTAACQASLSITNSQSLLKLMSIESVMPSNHLILCRPLFLLPCLSLHQGLFQRISRIRWPKNWSLSFSISSSNKCSGLISFRMDWFDLLAVQGTLKSLLQHHKVFSFLLILILITSGSW